MDQGSQQILLFDGAEGTVEPSPERFTQVDSLARDLSAGKYYVSTAEELPYRCMEGRPSLSAVPAPMSAGATLGVYIADELTVREFTSVDISIEGGFKNVINDLHSQNLPVGAHDDDTHSSPQDCGCGVFDNLPRIYGMITRKPDVVKKYVEIILGAGVVGAELEQRILRNASQRTQFSYGADIYNVIKNIDTVHSETLHGDNREAVLVFNWRDGQVLSAAAVAGVYSDLQVFSVDVWSIIKACEKSSKDPRNIGPMIIGMMYFNVAASLVLAGPATRLVVVK
jgi:hypothetical protein